MVTGRNKHTARKSTSSRQPLADKENIPGASGLLNVIRSSRSGSPSTNRDSDGELVEKPHPLARSTRKLAKRQRMFLERIADNHVATVAASVRSSGIGTSCETSSVNTPVSENSTSQPANTSGNSEATVNSRSRNSLDGANLTGFGFGIGRGKGGLRRMAAVIQRQRQRAEIDSLRHIRNLEHENTCKFSIALMPFSRVVREILMKLKGRRDEGNQSIRAERFQSAAITTLLHAAEDFLLLKFEKCALLSAHAGRVTCMPKDLALAMRMDKNK